MALPAGCLRAVCCRCLLDLHLSLKPSVEPPQNGEPCGAVKALSEPKIESEKHRCGHPFAGQKNRKKSVSFRRSIYRHEERSKTRKLTSVSRRDAGIRGIQGRNLVRKNLNVALALVNTLVESPNGKLTGHQVDAVIESAIDGEHDLIEVGAVSIDDVSN